MIRTLLQDSSKAREEREEDRKAKRWERTSPKEKERKQARRGENERGGGGKRARKLERREPRPKNGRGARAQKEKETLYQEEDAGDKLWKKKRKLNSQSLQEIRKKPERGYLHG